MDKDTTVLLIDEDAAGIDSIRRILGDKASRFKLRRVADVPTALARIWGGGIDLVLLNLPSASGCAENPLAPFLRIAGEGSRRAGGGPLRFRRRKSGPNRGGAGRNSLSPARNLRTGSPPPAALAGRENRAFLH